MAAMTPLLMTYAMSEASNQQAQNNLAASHALEEAQSKEQAALEKTVLRNSVAADEKNRKAALRRAVASQKAKFGSQGVSSSGGSSEAVLLGIIEDSEDDQQESDNVSSLKLAAIDQDLNQEKALNVLQRTQLEERNNLSLFSKLF